MLLIWLIVISQSAGHSDHNRDQNCEDQSYRNTCIHKAISFGLLATAKDLVIAGQPGFAAVFGVFHLRFKAVRLGVVPREAQL